MAGLQEYWAAPLTDNCTVLPKQTFISLVAVTSGVGLTVIAAFLAAPVHPLAEAITLIRAVTVVSVVLKALKEAILPVPLAAKPIEGVLFIQLNVEPVCVLENMIAVVAAPLHNAWFTG